MIVLAECPVQPWSSPSLLWGSDCLLTLDFLSLSLQGLRQCPTLSWNLILDSNGDNTVYSFSLKGKKCSLPPVCWFKVDAGAPSQLYLCPRDLAGTISLLCPGFFSAVTSQCAYWCYQQHFVMGQYISNDLSFLIWMIILLHTLSFSVRIFHLLRFPMASWDFSFFCGSPVLLIVLLFVSALLLPFLVFFSHWHLLPHDSYFMNFGILRNNFGSVIKLRNFYPSSSPDVLVWLCAFRLCWWNLGPA